MSNSIFWCEKLLLLLPFEIFSEKKRRLQFVKGCFSAILGDRTNSTVINEEYRARAFKIEICRAIKQSVPLFLSPFFYKIGKLHNVGKKIRHYLILHEFDIRAKRVCVVIFSGSHAHYYSINNDHWSAMQERCKRCFGDVQWSADKRFTKRIRGGACHNWKAWRRKEKREIIMDQME